jgi:hypothetical protein
MLMPLIVILGSAGLGYGLGYSVSALARRLKLAAGKDPRQ